MPDNSLVPVHTPGVEYRPLPELYPAGIVEKRFDNERLHLVTKRDGINEHKPDLFSFRNRGGFRQRAAYIREFSFTFGRRWGESGYRCSSIKSNLKMSGTYDVNGDLITISKEKGIYIDQFS